MKQRMKKMLIYFFIFMIVANIVCRVRDTYMIPRVMVSSPVRTELTHTMQAEGYFTSSDKEYIQPKAGWKIGKVFVKMGTQVNEQTVLWQYDLAYLKELLLDKQENLKKKQIAIEQAKMTYASQNEVSTETLAMQDVEKSANQVICEQIWLEEAVSQYEKKIDEINQKYDKKEELARQEHGISYSTEIDDTQKALLDTNLATQINELEESRKEEKENAYQEIISQNESLFQAMQNLDSAEQNYNNAVIMQQESQKQMEKNNKNVTLTISALEMEEKKLIDEIASIEECIQAQGYVYTEKSGSIINVELIEGHLASGQEKIEIGGSVDTFMFSLPEEETALLTKEDKCYIQVAGMSDKKEGMIEALWTENMENQKVWTISCVQTGGESWSECRWNQQGMISICKKTQEYNCCIPIKALVCQSGEYYCRIVTEEQTILGKEEVIEEIPVMLVDKDATYAYVVGEIHEGCKVVTDYNKTITDGDRVRVVSRL